MAAGIVAEEATRTSVAEFNCRFRDRVHGVTVNVPVLMALPPVEIGSGAAPASGTPGGTLLPSDYFLLTSVRLSSAPLEPVTHFLFGATMGRAGLNRHTALATATLTLAAEAPDLDVFSRLFGNSVFGFAHHRGFTHSFLGVPIVAAVVVAFMYGIWRLRRRRTHFNLPPRWGLLYGYACLAGISHILLDFTNHYGVRPFWPFSERWYSWDIVFIVEPVLLVVMILGLIVPKLFSLINEEIGARQKGPPGRFAATLALIAIVAFWGVRDYEHRRAIAALESRVYNGVDALRVSAYPYWVNPFRWYAVVETPAFFAQMDVDSLAPEVDREGQMQIRYKPEETPVTLAAKKSYLGRVYLDWARYPITETEELDDASASDPPGGTSGSSAPTEHRAAYVVRFIDLRYAAGFGARNPLGARVVLDRDLKVIGEQFGNRARGAPD